MHKALRRWGWENKGPGKEWGPFVSCHGETVPNWGGDGGVGGGWGGEKVLCKNDSF